jgi:predicted metalloenzyme YecM
MEGAAPFLAMVLARLEKLGIDVAELQADHLCYRVETAERYHGMQSKLACLGVLLGENIIGGRPIATYRLHEAVRVQGQVVDVVELPAPKPGSPYPEGFEHAEFVVAGELEDLMRKHSGLDWDTDGLHKAHNPELRLHLGAASAKFHRTALSDLIAAEQRGQS